MGTPEHLRFGKAEGMEDSAGCEIDFGPKLDDELHANGPLADLVAFGHSEAAIDIAAHRADRPISNDRQRSVNIHSRSKAGFWIAGAIHALI